MPIKKYINTAEVAMLTGLQQDDIRNLAKTDVLPSHKNRRGHYRFNVDAVEKYCTFEELHIPYTCNLEKLPIEEYPIFGSERVQGLIYPWDRPYAQEDEVDDSSYLTNDVKFTDEHGVAYSQDKKRLLWSNKGFDEKEYHVPDGVGTICSYAFAFCSRFLTLSLPSSVSTIGHNLFGKEGGRILIRRE